MKQLLIALTILSGLFLMTTGVEAKPSREPAIGLTLIPPSPVTTRIREEIRGAVWNHSKETRKCEVAIYLDSEKSGDILRSDSLTIPAKSAAGVRYLLPTKDKAGHHRIIMVVKSDGKARRIEQDLTIIPSKFRSTERIGGAWVGITHWSEKEGRHWNAQIKKMTDEDWRQLVRGMHGVGMNVIVIQQVFENQVYDYEDSIITQHGYKGLAYYPSKLYPGRMKITARDPIGAILTEADKLGMHVFLGVGMYAWFDYSHASLVWHEKVAKELWGLYGYHPSFYGWYISEEGDGSLGDSTHRKQMVRFFREFTPYVHNMAPGKPVMLATNCWHLLGAQSTYLKLLPNVDILCPFAFARMPKGDETGAQAAALLGRLCKESGTHMWLDMEVFVFDKEGGLIPRPISGIMSDMHKYTRFEKTLCYQYPGLLTAPDAAVRLGGEPAVKLYLEYQKYLWSLPR